MAVKLTGGALPSRQREVSYHGGRGALTASFTPHADTWVPDHVDLTERPAVVPALDVLTNQPTSSPPPPVFLLP